MRRIALIPAVRDNRLSSAQLVQAVIFCSKAPAAKFTVWAEFTDRVTGVSAVLFVSIYRVCDGFGLALIVADPFYCSTFQADRWGWIVSQTLIKVAPKSLQPTPPRRR